MQDAASVCTRVGFQGALRWLAATVLGCLALALLTAPPAGAVPTWLSPVNLSAGGQNAEHPKVAVDARGDAIAIWRRFNGTNWIVQAAVRPAGGQWQAPIDLSADGQNSERPEIAVDSRDDAVAVWERYNGANWILQGAVRPARGQWQAPVDLADERETAYEPQVAMDPRGDAVAVWRRSNGANFGANRIVQGVLRPADGEWQAPVNLSAEGENSYGPQVTMDPRGDAVAVWSSYNGVAPRTFIIQGTLRPAGGAWQAPVKLSPEGHEAYKPQVAVDPRGAAVAVWERYSGTNWAVQGARRPPRQWHVPGGWDVPVNLSEEGQSARFPQVAMDADGDAVAVWQRYNGTDWIIQSAG
jgi:hypothetical protein